MNLEARRNKSGREFYGHFTNLIAGPKGVEFHHGNPFRIVSGKVTLGLRVCLVSVDCGFDNDRLLKSMNSKIISHLVPWETKYVPTAGSNGRYITIEAVWPPGLERADITLASLDIKHPSGNKLVIGPSQAGEVITLPSHDIVHLLVGGMTDSGKSFLIRSLTSQLSQACKGQDNMLVMLDGKGGEGLGILQGSHGQVGPLALNAQTSINALGWTIDEMNRRYDAIQQNGGRSLNGDFPHVFVIFDEFQRYTKDGSNPTIVEQMNVLATQGRAAHIHLIASTQKPLVGVFGDSTTPDQFAAAIGGKVKSHYASRAIMGGSYPRCDTLLPQGDMWVSASVPHLIIERVQVAYIPERWLAPDGEPLMMDAWPEYDTSKLGGEERVVGRPPKTPTFEELAVGLLAAAGGKKRYWFREQFEGDTPGADRSDKIIEQCYNILAEVTRRGGQLNAER